MFYVELSRAALEGDVLQGYAAVYEEPTAKPVNLAGRLIRAGGEVIARGAFDGVPWENGEIVATVNHDPSRRLGSTVDGAVSVGFDSRGMTFAIDLSKSADLGRMVRAGVDSGAYRGMSFTARMGDVRQMPGRFIHQKFASLSEISVVSSPAYAGAIAREAAHQSVREQLLRARYRVLMERNGK